MLSQHAAAERPVATHAADRPQEQQDRAMQVLQYAVAVGAMVAAALLAIAR